MTIPRLVWAISASSALVSATWAQPAATPPTPKPEASATAPTEFTAEGIERAMRSGNGYARLWLKDSDRSKALSVMTLERLVTLLRDDPQFQRGWRFDEQNRAEPGGDGSLPRDVASLLLRQMIEASRAPGKAMTESQLRVLVPFLESMKDDSEIWLAMALGLPTVPADLVPQIEDLFAHQLRRFGLRIYDEKIPAWITDSRRVVADALLETIKHPTIGMFQQKELAHAQLEPRTKPRAQTGNAWTPVGIAPDERSEREYFFDARLRFLNIDAIRLIGPERLLEQTEAETVLPDVRAALAAALWKYGVVSARDFRTPVEDRIVPGTLHDRIRKVFRTQLLDADIPVVEQIGLTMLEWLPYGFNTDAANRLSLRDFERQQDAQAIIEAFQARPERFELRYGMRSTMRARFERAIAEQATPLECR